MSDWTSEPWPEWDQDWTLDGTELPVRVLGHVNGERVVGINMEDYDRARACVNALAGRVPEKLKAMEAAVDRLVGAAARRFDASELRDIVEALAAFRGDTHE